MEQKKHKKLRIAAVGDIHVKEHFRDEYVKYFQEISSKADVLVLCGDLTDLGLSTEAELLANDLKSCRIPVVGVLGNHDYQSNQPEEVKQILMQNENVQILEREAVVINGVGFAGVKGFIGGFGAHALGSFGEPLIKEIIRERDHEAFSLENQLKTLSTEKKVVIMHYSPIRATVADEADDIMPFLGATRYEQTIEQYGASVVFHGHANLGPHEGKTLSGIPVFNVAYPLLQNVFPKHPYKIFEV